ncbi:hypothetical protein B0H14DRAFT_2611057 [Mycena olivaceomarginata]|nr:hypothetical protein B0H14DRAFT_2611057 [Mycena olivaceomarginata]
MVSSNQEVDCSFTPTQRICQKCKAPPAPGEALVYLNPQMPNQTGRSVCGTCHRYYQQKTVARQTQKRSGPSSTLSMPPPPPPAPLQNVQKVHKDIARSKRGDKDVRVERLGSASLHGFSAGSKTHGTPLGFYSGQGVNFGSFAPWAPSSDITGNPGPNAVSSQYQPYSPYSTLSPYYTPAPEPNFAGYTLSHLKYDTDKERRAKQAYAAHGGYTVTIEVHASHMPVGKTRCKLIGAVLEVIDDVPVHIGAVDLKNACFNAINLPWLEFSDNYIVDVNSLHLRDDRWAPILPKDPDVDAIAHRFYFPPKKGSTTPQFRNKKITLHIHFPNRVFDEYTRLKEAKDQEYQNDFQMLVEVQNSLQSEGDKSMRISAKAKGKGRATRASDTASPLSSWTSRPSTPPPSLKRRLPDSPGSPQYSREQVEKMIKLQTPASRLQLGSLCKVFRISCQIAKKALNAVVYPMKDMTSLSDLDSGEWSDYCEKGRSVSIVLSTDPKEQKVGSFKMATYGVATPPVFGLDANVCAKQSYYESKGLQIAGTNNVTVHNVAHDVGRQAKVLTMELQCLSWARVLLRIVYHFVQRFIRMHNHPPFTIPQLVFVDAALAMIPGPDKDLYLLEQCITDNNEGKFRKYINNRAAIPTIFENDDDKERAEFLAFSQHYQYLKTHKMLFVSDYQGGNTLLTDPQIMSAP